MDCTPSAPSAVTVTREPITLPTYRPAAPDRNPMFLDKRVYQGSSGRVYPLPFTDRIEEDRTEVSWDAVHLENAFIRLTILPEIGGRIHAACDKTNGHDFIYRQEVIKPALVGLAGPWISGGVELNWPQHHRPSTFMPTDVAIEEHPDGSKTVWLSEHEPMNRMKGMHGVCLQPGKAFIELKARVHNRTQHVQTFLWWANIAVRVHERYQSFFPPDVHYVADHAKRSMSAFPACQDRYYGVGYGQRARTGVPPGEQPSLYPPPGDYPANELSWYANIPVPTSFMAMGSREDFFGGYDHARNSGIVHVADHHIAPGKKQWTWGNHGFGYAWDRNLTDADANGECAPYIELMAGVYTDNQPDFSFLAPGETKTWSQFWYPIQGIGVPQKANLEAAVSLHPAAGGLRLGVCVSEKVPGARITLRRREDASGITSWVRDLSPGKPFIEVVETSAPLAEADVRVTVSQDERELIDYTPEPSSEKEVPPPATEPPPPEAVSNSDELYLTGLHLHQYRHATRAPELYWREALRRDPEDVRCNNAMGLWHLRRGEFVEAETHFRRAIKRLTVRNPNPYDGEPLYNLGLTLRHLGDRKAAYASFAKATWNYAWRAVGHFALAELDSCQGRWTSALEHLDRALRLNADHLQARNLRALVLRQLGRQEEAESFLQDTLAIDPLDWSARWIRHRDSSCDAQTRLDLALDYARSGFNRLAIDLLKAPDAAGESDSRALGTAPLTAYYLGWLHLRMDDVQGASKYFATAAALPPDYCFPARLEEIVILQAAIAHNPSDGQAHYLLGNLLYDRHRRPEAIELWEKSVKLAPENAVAWRNLGLAHYNVLNDAPGARAAYDRALRANPSDARLLYERDQLWKRMSVPPAERLQELEKHPDLVRQRDDLSVELCALYNQTAQPEKARKILERRHFQPWEGGEGQALGQHVRTHLALGREALKANDARRAREAFETALRSPSNLGEAKHLLANQSDIHYWLGNAQAALGNDSAARAAWQAAADFRGDFQEMAVKSFSDMTYYTALAMRCLGREKEAQDLFNQLLDYAEQLGRTPARIDYFATSLPTMLVFNEDIQFRQETTARFLEAQARLGLGEEAAGSRLLEDVLARDPNHPLASDLRLSLEKS